MFKFKRSVQLSRRQRPTQPTRGGAEPVLGIEPLETRELLATFVVSTVNDAGAGSLRDAITQANATAGLDNINFAIAGAGVKSIALASALPNISDPVVIDGTTQGASATPLIELNGTGAGATSSGLTVASTGGGSTIRGLAINRFAANGIFLSASNSNLIERCFIGTNDAGTAALANGIDGIRVIGNNNVIGGTGAGAGNLISGNSRHGVIITGAGTGNDLFNNTIGMNAARAAAIPNGNNGVFISNGSKNNDVGGILAGTRNFISGNGSLGVLIDGLGTDSNRVQGNFIGNGNGNTAGVGNLIGVAIRNGAKSNLIGDTNIGGQNIISGNTQFGVQIQGSTTSGNSVVGNRIGTESAGSSALANTLDGVLIDTGANANTIGGSTVSHMNIISGNSRNGVRISGVGTSNNKVLNNRIGLNAAGIAPLGNAQPGVQILSGATNNLVGDTGQGNQISGNGIAGVLIQNVGTTGNAVRGNTIGVDAVGATAPNSLDGVAITDGATGNTVGGIGTDHFNIIGGNTRAGVQISGAGTNGNFVQANRIGVNVAGTVSLPNAIGIWIANGAKSNSVGGLTTIERNFISGNSKFGVMISGNGTDNNLVQGNFIGVNLSATGLRPNGLDGVYVSAQAKNNTIGGTAAGAGNVIAANGRDGVGIQGAGTTGNSILGNGIGVNLALSGLPNGRFGVFVRGGATGTAIGNTTAGARNAISANGSDGIRVQGTGTAATIQNNLIGLAFDGVAIRGNSSSGIRVAAGATATIGGTAAGANNVISGNSGSGVLVDGIGTQGIVIQGNFIGTDVTGTLDKGNNGRGIQVLGGASDVTIGGTAAGARNVISGNTQPGIQVQDATTQNVVIQGNFIGVDVNGTTGISNATGVRVDFARNVQIGGTAAGAGNVISGNVSDGLLYVGNNVAGALSGNVVQGNFIGLNAAGTGAIPNQDGMQISNMDEGIVIGGSAAGAANFISGNSRFGIRISDSTGHRIQGNRIGLRSDGTTAQGNGSHGVFVFSNSSGNLIGGTAAGEGNIIANNNGDGVLVGSDPGLAFNVAAGAGNTISGNRIFANSGQAIDLGANDGATANDLNDPDVGPNNLQNKAVLDFATSLGNSTLVTGTLDGVVGNFRIEFFSGTGAGRADLFLGFVDENITSTTDLTFSAILPTNVPAGQFITVVVTNLDTGDSSEFSNSQVVL